MTYVVGSNCIGCKHTTCVEVCPVDAFREGENFLVIDPEECIDCDLCVDECPETAIFNEYEMPEDQIPFIELNAELSKTWPIIDQPKDPLPGHESCSGTKRNISDILK